MPIVKEYYDGGALKANGIEKSGLKEGKWIFYFETGEVQMEINYKNGLKDREFKRWHINGNLAIESYCVEGKNDGYWKEYYESGNIMEIGEYKGGEYYPTDFWDEAGIQILKNGSGKKIEKYGYLELDVYEHYFENGKFIREVKISSLDYRGFTPL